MFFFVLPCDYYACHPCLVLVVYPISIRRMLDLIAFIEKMFSSVIRTAQLFLWARTNNMEKRMIKDYQNISVDPESIVGALDFDILFGRSGPVEMEVGSGKGTFLLEEAKAFPEKFFFGIEWANKYYKHAVDRMGRWGMSNVRLMRTDAAIFIAEQIPDASIEVFHLYFPDPWPKKRHNKRRFFCDENLVQLRRILKPNGIINIATDHADYFEQMTEVAGRAIQQGTVKEIDFIRPAGAQEGETVGTNFERKYIKEGRKTNTLALQKV
jgi:tRNA (guanine-N7-)-methyltransferase